MVRCRLFEEASAKAYAQGKIGGFCHLYIGQEAVGVGAISTLGPEDKVLASYRDHAHFLARGGDAKAAMAELFGRASGCSSGLGGSMHFFDVEKGFLGGWGIVGGQIPLAAGAAFASKYRGDGGVALCFFGEGATNQGAFHEALSLSALWKLPAVFLCENNHYAMGTPQERGHAMREISGLASSYEIARDRVAEGSEDEVPHEARGRGVALAPRPARVRRAQARRDGSLSRGDPGDRLRRGEGDRAGRCLRRGLSSPRAGDDRRQRVRDGRDLSLSAGRAKRGRPSTSRLALRASRHAQGERWGATSSEPGPRRA
ncbi:hypothetical protein HY251_06330 [bacterium]|nr:hypothetical protein [bacterium]